MTLTGTLNIMHRMNFLKLGENSWYEVNRPGWQRTYMWWLVFGIYAWKKEEKEINYYFSLCFIFSYLYSPSIFQNFTWVCNILQLEGSIKILGEKWEVPSVWDLAEHGLRSIGELVATPYYNFCRVLMNKRSQIYRLLYSHDWKLVSIWVI